MCAGRPPSAFVKAWYRGDHPQVLRSSTIVANGIKFRHLPVHELLPLASSGLPFSVQADLCLLVHMQALQVYPKVMYLELHSFGALLEAF
jgi:hypothetical protein